MRTVLALAVFAVASAGCASEGFSGGEVRSRLRRWPASIPTRPTTTARAAAATARSTRVGLLSSVPTPTAWTPTMMAWGANEGSKKETA
jgi:hypothetical protein